MPSIEQQTMQTIDCSARTPAAASGQRLDQVAAALFPDYSRSQLQIWIKQGALTVDGVKAKASQRLVGGEHVQLTAQLAAHDEFRAEDIALDLLYEDNELLVVNKPVGLVVHPAAGNWSGTLQNALLHFDPALAALPRAGIVHRLDKDTSGALVVARTMASRQALVAAMQERRIERRYIALAWGQPRPTFSVDAPIGRHPRERTRMAVVASGKPARTHLTRIERWRHGAWLEARLESGRTHQIRVHCTHAGYPLVGDPVYGRNKLPADLAPELAQRVSAFQRQALHARHLALVHPVSGELLEWQAPVPDDLAELIAAFREYDAE